MKTHTIRLLSLFAAFAFGATLTLAAADTPAAAPAKTDCKQCTAEKSACCDKEGMKKECTKTDSAKMACTGKEGCECPHCAADKAAGKSCVKAAMANCPVSGEKLGEMGEPYAYTYKQEGKPDRTIMLCCKMCVKKFEKDPAKYLSVIDAATPTK